MDEPGTNETEIYKAETSKLNILLRCRCINPVHYTVKRFMPKNVASRLGVAGDGGDGDGGSVGIIKVSASLDSIPAWWQCHT